VIKDLVLSKISFKLLTISQAPEGVFDQTLCQHLSLDKKRVSRFIGNTILAPLATVKIPKQGQLANNSM
jgi:hypothetical protein